MAEFRRTMGRFASGVTVMTSVHDGAVHGMTANAVTSLSLEPLRLLVCVAHRAWLRELVIASRVFALTVLAADQEDVSAHFASPSRPPGHAQFDRYRWSTAPVTGSPLIEGGLVYLDCRLVDVYAGGDHSILVGDVVDLGDLGGTAPLLWFGGTYHRLDSCDRAGEEHR